MSPAAILDLAEAQAEQAGFATVQEYCHRSARPRPSRPSAIREQVADIEARRGPLEGLNEIADDPEYLAELSAAGPHRATAGSTTVTRPPGRRGPHPVLAIRVEGRARRRPMNRSPRLSRQAISVEPVLSTDTTESLAGVGSCSGTRQSRLEDDPLGVPPLPAAGRAGASLPEVAELAQALRQLEERVPATAMMDRRLTLALAPARLRVAGPPHRRLAGRVRRWTVEISAPSRRPWNASSRARTFAITGPRLTPGRPL